MKLGQHMTEEQRARCSIAHSNPSLETRAKIAASKKGKPSWNKGISPSDVTRAKMSAAAKERIPSDVCMRAMWKANLGGHLSEETRTKLSVALKGRSVWNKGIPTPEAVKAKIASAHMGMHESGETRARVSLGRMGQKASPETRAKLSLAHWRGGSKLASAKHEAKRRTLGFIPINSPFVGADAHHLDREQVIYIPQVLHQSVRHNVWNGRNMDKINTVAYEWLAKESES